MLYVCGTQNIAWIDAWFAIYLTASGPVGHKVHALEVLEKSVSKGYDWNMHRVADHKPRVSYKGTETKEYAEQAWSTMSHSGLLMKYSPMQDPYSDFLNNVNNQK